MEAKNWVEPNPGVDYNDKEIHGIVPGNFLLAETYV